MKVSNTADRLAQLMDERGLKQADIVRLCERVSKHYTTKVTRADVSMYVNGIIEPGSKKLTILGMALNVSEAWLMGLDVEKERGKIEPKIELTEEEIEMVRMYRQMSDIGKEYINHIMDMELKNNGKEK